MLIRCMQIQGFCKLRFKMCITNCVYRGIYGIGDYRVQYKLIMYTIMIHRLKNKTIFCNRYYNLNCKSKILFQMFAWKSKLIFCFKLNINKKCFIKCCEKNEVQYLYDQS